MVEDYRFAAWFDFWTGGLFGAGKVESLVGLHIGEGDLSEAECKCRMCQLC